jgi:DNA end-binding protein Ku
MATQLVQSMGDDWNPKQYRDTYTDRVNDLIKAKRKGNDFQAADEAPEATNVVDLIEALRRSVDSTRGAGRKPKKAVEKKAAAKKAPAKKAAANRTSKSGRTGSRKAS